MSDNPSSKPPASRPPAKTAGSGTAGTKASGGAKAKAGTDETFDFLAPPQAPDELGRLEHYRILKVLGKGGMGIVFMAEDTKLHRIVGLKVMLPAIAMKAIARDRFLREARATAAIEHDHIVTIYEVSKEDSPVPFIAMQFLKGMTLEDWLRAGKTLNIPQVMRIAKEIAKALAAAHSHGLIHRDIKPSNIWLDAANKGRVKILDFGLARPTNEETHLTQEGMILGSPAYMSPEQARGQNVDERCDLFSLGCVMYRLCAGKLPFTGKDAMSMLLSITSDEPPGVSRLNDEVPPALADVVHRLLAKKPDDRPASAKAVVQTIQTIERDWIANARTSAVRPVQEKPIAPDETVAADAEGIDPALEESAITDLELPSAPTAAMSPAPPRSRSWIFAGLGCSLVSVLSILCCLFIAISTNHGSIEVITDGEAARELAEGAGITVRDHNKKAHVLKLGAQSLPAGGYNVDTDTLPRGLQIEPATFTLSRGEHLEIRLHPTPPRLAPAIVLVTADQARKIQQDWATYLGREIVEAKMVLIPPGEFQMGSTQPQINQQIFEAAKKFRKESLPENFLKLVQAEKPQHRVRISKPFYMGMTEVTVGQFSRFTNGAEYKPELMRTGKGGTGLEAGREIGRKPEFTWLTPGYEAPTEYPVTNVTWSDAEAYCAWLSKKDKKTYRLPTEAEWEYACRAGTTEMWSFGDDIKDQIARKYMWYHSPFKLGANPLLNPITPKAVGVKTANTFGLHDMHGNVAEMCSDIYGPFYYAATFKEGFPTDPKGPEADLGQGRVVRGGSFLDAPPAVRSAYRRGIDPTLGYATVGFRVVCEAPLPE